MPARLRQMGGCILPTRLDGNNTCTVQTYTNSVGARVESLQPEGHEEKIFIVASHCVLKTESSQKTHRTRTYGYFRGHQTLKTVRSW